MHVAVLVIQPPQHSSPAPLAGTLPATPPILLYTAHATALISRPLPGRKLPTAWNNNAATCLCNRQAQVLGVLPK